MIHPQFDWLAVATASMVSKGSRGSYGHTGFCSINIQLVGVVFFYSHFVKDASFTNLDFVHKMLPKGIKSY